MCRLDLGICGHDRVKGLASRHRGSSWRAREAMLQRAVLDRGYLVRIRRLRPRNGELGGSGPMQETPQEYVERILGYLDGKDPLKVQMGTAKQLGRLIKGASPSALRQRPAPGKWSVAEILAHLADTEIVGSWRIRAILGAPGTALQPFDQDAWVASGHYDRRHPRLSLELFRVLREMNPALFKALPPEQWGHHGLHGEPG